MHVSLGILVQGRQDSLLLFVTICAFVTSLWSPANGNFLRWYCMTLFSRLREQVLLEPSRPWRDPLTFQNNSTHNCVCVCGCVYICICMCVYIGICIYTHTHNQPKSEKRNRDLIPFLCLFLSKHVTPFIRVAFTRQLPSFNVFNCNCLNGNVKIHIWLTFLIT